MEELMAEEEARNATARDSTTYVNHKVEEMCKAARGIDSPLGEAVLAFHRRWASHSQGRIAASVNSRP